MKDLLKIMLIFAAFVFVIPLVGFAGREKADDAPQQAVSETVRTSTSEKKAEEETPTDDVFAVFDITSGKVTEMPMRDYLVGAVMAEMPAVYEPEALKAQAVAAYTYALRREKLEKEAPTAELMGAFISNDSTKYQAFFTPEQAQSFYGDKYAEYNEKVQKAAESVINEVLVSGGEPIIAALHAVSSGQTESAEVVWGSAVDYLVPAESPQDTSAPNYIEEKIFTAAELKARLTQSEYNITLPADKSEWLKVNSVSPSGTVTDVSAGDKHISGSQLRTLLNLRSACITVEYNADKGYIITTKGSGHGVGMSQYGANKMAENGSSCREILLHYYSGAEIVTIDSDLS